MRIICDTTDAEEIETASEGMVNVDVGCGGGEGTGTGTVKRDVAGEYSADSSLMPTSETGSWTVLDTDTGSWMLLLESKGDDVLLPVFST